MNTEQGIFHLPTGRWVTNIKEGKDLKPVAILSHSPYYIAPDFRQNYGETKLHGVMNKFKHRDKFFVKTFDESPVISISI